MALPPPSLRMSRTSNMNISTFPNSFAHPLLLLSCSRDGALLCSRAKPCTWFHSPIPTYLLHSFTSHQSLFHIFQHFYLQSDNVLKSLSSWKKVPPVYCLVRLSLIFFSSSPHVFLKELSSYSLPLPCSFGVGRKNEGGTFWSQWSSQLTFHGCGERGQERQARLQSFVLSRYTVPTKPNQPTNKQNNQGTRWNNSGTFFDPFLLCFSTMLLCHWLTIFFTVGDETISVLWSVYLKTGAKHCLT